MRKIRIFISSPGDVGEERRITERTIERLQLRFSARVHLEMCLWEHLPMRATSTFQDQIPRPGDFDIVVMILWSRIGTRLSQDRTRPDGSAYASGTEYEFEDAVNAAKQRGLPHLLVFRKTARVMVEMSGNETELLEISRQKKAVDQFIDRWFLSPDGSFKAAFTQFDSAADYEDRLEDHLRSLVEDILRQRSPGSGESIPGLVNPLWDRGSPFRGLQRFEYEDALIYFGRTEAIQQALGAFREQAARGVPFLLVFGNSGVGKSSFARAGIVPFLTDPGVMEGVAVWRRTIFEPSDSTGDLLDGLAAALVNEGALPELLAGATEDELAELLRDKPTAAIPLLRAALAGIAPPLAGSPSATNPPLARLLLLIDPLEEVFTRPGSTREDRDRLFVALDALARSGLIWVLSTMRSDFYERCGEHPQLLGLKDGRGQYHLAPPTSVEISHMIRLPAQLAALHFENHPQRGSLDDLLKEVASADPAALPLLQFTLDEIYKKSNAHHTQLLTFAAYDELGGMSGALRTRAEETIEEVRRELGDRTESTFSTVFSALVGLNPDADRTVVRLYAYLDRIRAHPDASRLVDALIEARLFITDIDDEQKPVVTLCHEAMLKHWPRLAEWIDGNRDFLRTRARIASAVVRWNEEGREIAYLLGEGKPLAEGVHLLDRRNDLTVGEIEYIEASQNAAHARRRMRRRRTRIVVTALLGITILALGGWAISISMYRKSEQHAKAEEQQRESATGRARAAQELVEFLLEDLRDSLAPNQERDSKIIAKISNKVLAHYNSLDPARDSEEVKLEHASNLLSVARIFEKMARFKEAGALAEKSRLLRESVLKQDDPLLADCLELEGLCHNQMGDFQEAEDAYDRAIKIYDLSGGKSTPLLGVVCGRLGELCRQKARFVEAAHWHERSLNILEQTTQKDSYEVGVRYSDLGELFRNTRKYDRAMTCLDKALAIVSQSKVPNQRQLAEVTGNKGMLLFEMEKQDDAKQLLEKALQIDIDAVGEANQYAAADRYKLARVLIVKKDFKTAAEHLEKSEEVLKKEVGEDHLRMAKCQEVLADLLLAQGNLPEAEKAARRVYAIRTKKLKAPHPEIAKVMDQLGRILQAQQNKEADNLLAEAQTMLQLHAAQEQAAEKKLALAGGG